MSTDNFRSEPTIHGSDPTVGSLFAGRYRVEAVLGRGSMGLVFGVVDQRLGERRALKLVPWDLVSDKRVVGALEREARAGTRLSHPNIVKIMHWDEWDGRPYLLMEWVEGRSLLEVLSEERRVQEKCAVRWACQVCRALGHAHARGIIHRDLKPSNIMLARDGKIRVMDFGIARVVKEGWTRLGTVGVGTLGYMSPEQIEGRPLDGRVDIYALGVVIYELVSGRLPFEGGGEVAHRHLHERPQRPEGMGAELWAVVSRCLEKDPRKRYEGARELYRALRAVATGELDRPARKGALDVQRVEQRTLGVQAHVRRSAGPAYETGTCPECGRSNPEEVRFCRWCGAGLFEACPACGREDRRGLEYCGGCGVKIAEEKERRRSVLLQEVEKTLVGGDLASLERAQEELGKLRALLPGDAEVEGLRRRVEERLEEFYPRGERAGEPRVFEIWPGVEMEFVWIPSGKFLMGSPEGEEGRSENEGPVHEVEITRGFWLGRYQVTQAQWRGVMGDNPSYFKGDERPVERVSWDDVQEFIRRLNERLGLTAYRLPTEAEWEYACRAGTRTRFSFGDSDADLGEHAWFEGNSSGETHPVGERKGNGWGLFDMHGNVWEWCSDWFGETYYSESPRDDPQGPSSGEYRVLRGGAWYNIPWFCRSANRGNYGPGCCGFGIGVRLVRASR
jgi:formylglycine-generating enzyme required for sulfatase activity